MKKERIIGLDILRGMAIVMVLFRHGDHINFIQEIGWVSVDLFFVLSGFLVSGLLFGEYKRTKKLRIKRFLIRRSLKIFPSFYVYLISFVLIANYIFNEPINPRHLIHEVLYVQNYLPGLNVHTWSLAVEEQFYISFAILIFLAFKLNLLHKKVLILSVLTIMVLTVVALRLEPGVGLVSGFTETHLRVDGILLGVMFSYLAHFTNFTAFISKRALGFLLLAFLLLVPIFTFEGLNSMRLTLSFFSMNLGFAVLVSLASNKELYTKTLQIKALSLGARSIAFVGVHSYSIYLWHSMVKAFIASYIIDDKLALVLYFVLTIGVGIGLSILVEQPILKLRNRYFSDQERNPSLSK